MNGHPLPLVLCLLVLRLLPSFIFFYLSFSKEAPSMSNYVTANSGRGQDDILSSFQRLECHQRLITDLLMHALTHVCLCLSFRPSVYLSVSVRSILKCCLNLLFQRVGTLDHSIFEWLLFSKNLPIFRVARGLASMFSSSRSRSSSLSIEVRISAMMSPNDDRLSSWQDQTQLSRRLRGPTKKERVGLEASSGEQRGWGVGGVQVGGTANLMSTRKRAEDNSLDPNCRLNIKDMLPI